jgi:very-short-patch-repair endonuclease
MASCCTERDLEAAIAEAFAVGLVNKNMLQRAVEEAGGRRGIARIQALIGSERRPSRIRSKPERALRHLLRAARIDGFETNVRIGPWEVDFYWRELGLVVEVDAFITHSSPWAFDRDRRKTADLEDRGLKVLRVTDLQIEHEPKAVVDRIQRRLRALDADLRRDHRVGG